MLLPWVVNKSATVAPRFAWVGLWWIRYTLLGFALLAVCTLCHLDGKMIVDQKKFWFRQSSNDNLASQQVQMGSNKFITGVYRIQKRFLGVTETVDLTVSKPRNVRVHSTGRFGVFTYYTTYTYKNGVIKVQDIPATGMRVLHVHYDEPSDALRLTIRCTWLFMTRTVTAKRIR